MNPAAIFFWMLLLIQGGFTAALMGIVARRFPARARAYRWIAPAAVPLFFCGMAALSWSRTAGAPAGDLPRLALAYVVLWLAGVVWAGMVARWSRR